MFKVFQPSEGLLEAMRARTDPALKNVEESENNHPGLGVPYGTRSDARNRQQFSR